MVGLQRWLKNLKMTCFICLVNWFDDFSFMNVCLFFVMNLVNLYIQYIQLDFHEVVT